MMYRAVDGAVNFFSDKLLKAMAPKTPQQSIIGKEYGSKTLALKTPQQSIIGKEYGSKIRAVTPSPHTPQRLWNGNEFGSKTKVGKPDMRFKENYEFKK